MQPFYNNINRLLVEADHVECAVSSNCCIAYYVVNSIIDGNGAILVEKAITTYGRGATNRLQRNFDTTVRAAGISENHPTMSAKVPKTQTVTACE